MRAGIARNGYKISIIWMVGAEGLKPRILCSQSRSHSIHVMLTCNGLAVQVFAADLQTPAWLAVRQTSDAPTRSCVIMSSIGHNASRKTGVPEGLRAQSSCTGKRYSLPPHQWQVSVVGCEYGEPHGLHDAMMEIPVLQRRTWGHCQNVGANRRRES